MKLDQLVSQARETITVRRVFADPYEKDGVTLIPAARVAGGVGGGGGHDDHGQEGEGGGLGVNARPTGVYVIKQGQVRWVPAVDVNRLFTILGAVAAIALLTRPRLRLGRPRASRRRHHGPQLTAVRVHRPGWETVRARARRAARAPHAGAARS
jgi:uncharacterized spore protein YtfJ